MDEVFEAVRQNDLETLQTLVSDNPEYLQVQREYYHPDGRSVYLTPLQYAQVLHHLQAVSLLRDIHLRRQGGEGRFLRR